VTLQRLHFGSVNGKSDPHHQQQPTTLAGEWPYATRTGGDDGGDNVLFHEFPCFLMFPVANFGKSILPGFLVDFPKKPVRLSLLNQPK
jgi:hypothetical protein